MSSLLVSDGLSLVKSLHSLLLLTLVHSPFVACETLDYLVICIAFLEGVLCILVLVYVFCLFDDWL